MPFRVAVPAYGIAWRGSFGMGILVRPSLRLRAAALYILQSGNGILVSGSVGSIIYIGIRQPYKVPAGKVFHNCFQVFIGNSRGCCICTEQLHQIEPAQVHFRLKYGCIHCPVGDGTIGAGNLCNDLTVYIRTEISGGNDRHVYGIWDLEFGFGIGDLEMGCNNKYIRAIAQ